MGIKSFFWSLNRNNSNFIQIIRKFVYQEGEKEKLERGRKTLPHFCATLQTEPWGPMAVFQSRFFELGTDWSCSLLKPQAELLVCFLHWRASVWCARTYIWKNFHWNGFQRALLETTPAAADTKQNGLLQQPQKQPMLGDQPRFFWVLDWATFGAWTQLCKFCLSVRCCFSASDELLHNSHWKIFL